MDNVLSVSNVTIDYNKVDVVFDASFSVKRGEVFGLVGLNGAGKTTLIKTILGLHAPRLGEISLFDAANTDMGARKNLVYLPERFDPPWFLSGMEFVKFSVSLYGKRCADAQIIEAAEKLALDPKALKRRVQSYSKGMRQKLGLIGTVLTGCELIILDEPMSGLDPLARTLVKDMLMEIKAKDQTIVMCSHILADLDEMCQNMALIHQGKIEFVGKPAELKKKTKTDVLERAFLHFIQTHSASDQSSQKEVA